MSNASVAGAAGNDGSGMTGVCWQVLLVAIKGSNPQGSTTTADLIEGINYSVLVGCRIAKFGFGLASPSEELRLAIEYAGAAGQLQVCAAGNASADADITPIYPAAFDCPSVISVTATDRTDARVSWANWGAVSVDLGAPGRDILAAALDGEHATRSGTSFAAAHVSGACGLLLAYRPGIAAAEVKRILLATVDPIADLAGRCVSGGRLNLAAAIRAAGLTTRLIAIRSCGPDGQLTGAQAVLQPGGVVVPPDPDGSFIFTVDQGLDYTIEFLLSPAGRG